MLPPDIVVKLHECASTDFIALRDVWFSRQSWFSVAVIVGLILELPELAYEMRALARRIERFRYCIVIRENRVEVAKVVAFVGWIFIVGGLLGELKAANKIEDLSGHIQTCNEVRVAEVNEQAGDAKASAREAAVAAKRAKEEADQVTRIANAAKSLASDAKTGAADASQQVSGLQSQAKSLQTDIAAEKEELVRLKSPRQINNSDEFVAILSRFPETKYGFVGVYPNEESIQVLRALDNLLKQVGWKRVDVPRVGVPWGLDVWGNNSLNVAQSISFGIKIAVSLPNPPVANSKITSDSPACLQAGSWLKWLLSKNLFPPEEGESKKAVETPKGDSEVVLITVGSKP